MSQLVDDSGSSSVNFPAIATATCLLIPTAGNFIF